MVQGWSRRGRVEANGPHPGSPGGASEGVGRFVFVVRNSILPLTMLSKAVFSCPGWGLRGLGVDKTQQEITQHGASLMTARSVAYQHLAWSGIPVVVIAPIVWTNGSKPMLYFSHPSIAVWDSQTVSGSR